MGRKMVEGGFSTASQFRWTKVTVRGVAAVLDRDLVRMIREVWER